MFFDLNVPLPAPGVQIPSSQSTKKGKQQQQQQQQNVADSPAPLVFTPAQIAAIEARMDLLVRLGYTVFALNQILQSKVDPKTHVNWFAGLIPKLKKRQGVMVLSRLTVVLDEESDRGNGINPQNAAFLSQYDILALSPTTENSFSLACLTHSLPSPQTTHIISIPMTVHRLPFRLKHTFIRTALKNGAVFEMDYCGAIGAESDRRNWWGAAREVVRVTKGNGILVSSGAHDMVQMRAPRDAANLITLLGIPQNLAHDTLSVTPKAVVLRAQSRKTYRSTLSEPKLVHLSTKQPTLEAAPNQSFDVADMTSTSQSREESTQPTPPLQSNTAASTKDVLTNRKDRKRRRENNVRSSGGKRQKIA